MPRTPLTRPGVLRRASVLLLILLCAVGAAGPAAAVEWRRGDPVSADPVGVWPFQPEPDVVEGFDPPDSPYGAGHRGVDLAGHVGQAVRAALPGRVTFAGMLAGRGVVVVGHGTTRTTYEPVAATVSVGDQVAGGAVIGTLQLSGSHCFPRTCLHWGWIEGETYLDPLRLVGAGPVRLLPLWRDDPVDAGPPAALSLPYAGWRPWVVGILTPGDVPVGRRGAAVRW